MIRSEEELEQGAPAPVGLLIWISKNWKKPKMWLLMIAGIIVLIVFIIFTNLVSSIHTESMKKNNDEPSNEKLEVNPVQKLVDDKRPAIAIVPFKIMGDAFDLSSDTGDILCDAFVSGIDSQQYQIYERGQLAVLLKENGFQASLLVGNTTSAAKFGRLAKVQYLVLGSLAKLGGEYHLIARVVDCNSGQIGKRGWVAFDSMRQWPNKMPELINKLGLRSDIENSKFIKPITIGETANDLIDTINPDANFQVQIRTAENKQTYLEDEYIKFVVTAERDCFVTLITVDSAGKMKLLLPNKWQMRAFIRSGGSITIPTDEMGFRFPIQPPHGQTMIKAIATVQPLKLSGVNTKNISNEGFITLQKGVKAIGIEALDGSDFPESIKTGSMSDLLKSHQWATDELMLITAKDKSAKEQSGQDLQKTSAGEKKNF